MLASAPELAGVSGKAFYERRELSTSDHSHDRDAQRRLWEVSAELTGLATPARRVA